MSIIKKMVITSVVLAVLFLLGTGVLAVGHLAYQLEQINKERTNIHHLDYTTRELTF